MTGLLFTGGRIWTGHPGHSGRPTPAAVAVRGGRIVAVGSEDEARVALAGVRVERVDLAGRALVPGFQDAHIHPVMGALERLRCDLSGLYTRSGYVTAIGGYAAANPHAEWLTGGGWSMAAFPGGLPHRDDLDALPGSRPVFLPNRDHHSAWVNSRALALAGIDAYTPDPPSGRIERDAAGQPTGVLHEAAMDLVARLVPEDTAEDYAQALLEAQRYLFSLGITGWQDAIVGAYAGSRDQFGTYLEADAAGSLKARVTGALWWDRERGAEQIDELIRRRSRAGETPDGRFRAGAVKIMQDGVPENFTAAMLEPYLDGCGCPGEQRGVSNVDPAALAEYVRLLDRAGFGVHFHAIGDRAVRECLDAVASARQSPRPDTRHSDPAHPDPRRHYPRSPDARHHIAHLQVVHPDDVARFAALDVTANMQALWATHHQQNDELCAPFLGEPRVSWQYPFGAIARSGGRLAAGSDWPVTTPDPWWAIHVAVHRTEPAVSPEAGWPSAGVPFLPEQALSLDQTLAAYTRGSAFVNGLDTVTGDITPGKAADLVVLDRDPFASDVALYEVGAALVFVDGDLVHEAG
jgi:predicted amidohydrolase YtcJ